MDIYPFCRGLKLKLREMMNARSDAVVTQQFTLDQYRYEQGVIHGLALAESIMLDLMKSAQLDEVDDPTS